MANLKGSKTEKNILTAFAGESQARNRYTFFASQAKKDGFVQISTIFEEIANQEKEHAKRLFKLLEGGEGGDYRQLSGRHNRDHFRESGGSGRRRALRDQRDVSRICQNGAGRRL